MSARCRICIVSVAMLALGIAPRIAWTQTYPLRPIHLVVGYAAGGGTDIAARVLGQWLSERLGQSVVIDNRPGATTNIGTELVVHAPPDGYTLLMATASNAINATLYEKLNFNFIADTVPVAAMMRVPQVMVVNPSFPTKTVPEFIAYAKSHPGGVNFASAGAGGTDHMAGELLKLTAGIGMTHVPYRGAAPALTDLLGAQVQVVFSSMPAAVEYVRANKLRALAVTSAARSEALPEVPTVDDLFPGYEASQWYGVGAPKNTPAEIVNRLNREINAALDDPKMRSRMIDLGGTPLPGSPAEFGRLIAADTEKWGKVVKAAGLKVD
jgi:tripartite-type tricarboxylate transporter receptor subunit TctC